MNGARALLESLVDCGVDTCFGNPGTSEMTFVAALDEVPQMRAVLCLFEGIVTGAADGYGRMADRPAVTLLHLGPGFANGLANLHNAMRARTPIVNLIGDHATSHKAFDSPLDSDVEAYARLVSRFVRSSTCANSVAADVADTVSAALGPPYGIASLVLPAEVSWNEVRPSSERDPDRPRPRPSRAKVSGEVIAMAAALLRGEEPVAILVGERALRFDGLAAIARIAQKTGAKTFSQTFPARIERGRSVPPIEALSYLPERSVQQLKGIRHLLLVDTVVPVAFFASQSRPSEIVPSNCEVHAVVRDDEDAVEALEHLVEALSAGHEELQLPVGLKEEGAHTGRLNAASIGASVASLLPEGAIVSDEGLTSSQAILGATASAAPHSWLRLTGGAIGQGLPVATGAAIARPDRRVVSIQADGSALYTIQALWTQARESLNIVTIILANRSYAVLKFELERAGCAPGPRALSMLDLCDPTLNFVALAEAMGVPADRVETVEQFHRVFASVVAKRGPHLIEAII